MTENIISIEKDGAIVIANRIVIDGHSNVSDKVRIVTHVHSDHTVNLSTSIKSNYKLIGTQITLGWLPILGYPVNSNSLELNYGSRIRIGDLSLELIRSHHIPGTAQVLIECDDGSRILYSSDFKKPGMSTPLVDADTLIVDAVYGKPHYVRDFDNIIESLLVDFVKQLLSEGGVHIFGYYGKLNEVMSVLREGGINAPFVLPQKIYMMTRKVENFGLRISDYVLAGTKEANEIIRSKWYVYLDHTFRARFRLPNGASSIILSGWEFEKPIKRLGPRSWHVTFSDHADFNGLAYYVSQVNPRTVYIVKARSNGAEEFASYISEKLGVKKVFVM